MVFGVGVGMELGGFQKEQGKGASWGRDCIRILFIGTGSLRHGVTRVLLNTYLVVLGLGRYDRLGT